MQMVQPLQQPTAVGLHQRSHIGHRADAKQIPGHADRFWFVQHIGNGMGQHIGQPTRRVRGKASPPGWWPGE